LEHTAERRRMGGEFNDAITTASEGRKLVVLGRVDEARKKLVEPNDAWPTAGPVLDAILARDADLNGDDFVKPAAKAAEQFGRDRRQP